MVLVKNLNFFYPFLKRKIGQENVFVNTLERKKCFKTMKMES